MDHIFGLVEDQISINREVSKVEDRVRIIKEAEIQVWIRLWRALKAKLGNTDFMIWKTINHQQSLIRIELHIYTLEIYPGINNYVTVNQQPTFPATCPKK